MLLCLCLCLSTFRFVNLTPGLSLVFTRRSKGSHRHKSPHQHREMQTGVFRDMHKDPNNLIIELAVAPVCYCLCGLLRVWLCLQFAIVETLANFFFLNKSVHVSEQQEEYRIAKVMYRNIK